MDPDEARPESASKLLPAARGADLASHDRAPCETAALTIPAAVTEVFALVSNARLWPRWHPAIWQASSDPRREHDEQPYTCRPGPGGAR